MRVLIAILCCFPFSVWAQSDLATSALQGVAQVGYLNPAIKSGEETQVGLPLISSTMLSVNSSRFPIREFIAPHPDSSYLVLDPENVYSKVNTTANLGLQASYDWFSIGKALGEKAYLRFAIRERYSASASLPYNLLRLASEGNALGLLGSSLNIDGFGMSFDWYREYYLSYSSSLNEHLRYGAALKLLQGISNLRSLDSDLSFSTGENFFDLRLNGEFSYQTSNTGMLRNDSALTIVSKTPFWSNNYGFGIDLGLDFDVNDKINLGLSLLDLGFINWNNRSQIHESSFDTLAYSGEDLLDLFANPGNSASTDLEGLSTDSVLNLLEVNSEDTEYRTSLTFSINTFFSYKINDKSLLHTNIRAIKMPFYWQTGVQLAYSRFIGENAQLGLSYAAGTNGLANLGVHGSLRFGPVQIYAASDNIIGTFLPQDVRYSGTRAGLNLLF